ncbi:hypothetical protein SISNIDRAFT_485309 [Sistotremastrum niveocremeum HHB9708]|uniref:Uncharacterized protein n=1 Tax=Sistotremastrum niveocremeum HHB9708 TaxID=1314777 RepID=A0A164V093_9AGAM|nr:hypothetical protein SISNIDRAFT_485309 [Sistotremastrum niveocremeum HHB9708]
MTFQRIIKAKFSRRLAIPSTSVKPPATATATASSTKYETQASANVPPATEPNPNKKRRSKAPKIKKDSNIQKAAKVTPKQPRSKKELQAFLLYKLKRVSIKFLLDDLQPQICFLERVYKIHAQLKEHTRVGEGYMRSSAIWKLREELRRVVTSKQTLDAIHVLLSENHPATANLCNSCIMALLHLCPDFTPRPPPASRQLSIDDAREDFLIRRSDTSSPAESILPTQKWSFITEPNQPIGKSTKIQIRRKQPEGPSVLTSGLRSMSKTADGASFLKPPGELQVTDETELLGQRFPIPLPHSEGTRLFESRKQIITFLEDPQMKRLLCSKCIKATYDSTNGILSPIVANPWYPSESPS